MGCEVLEVIRNVVFLVWQRRETPLVCMLSDCVERYDRPLRVCVYRGTGVVIVCSGWEGTGCSSPSISEWSWMERPNESRNLGGTLPSNNATFCERRDAIFRFAVCRWGILHAVTHTSSYVGHIEFPRVCAQRVSGERERGSLWFSVHAHFDGLRGHVLEIHSFSAPLSQTSVASAARSKLSTPQGPSIWQPSAPRTHSRMCVCVCVLDCVWMRLCVLVWMRLSVCVVNIAALFQIRYCVTEQSVVERISEVSCFFALCDVWNLTTFTQHHDQLKKHDAEKMWNWTKQLIQS